MRDELLRWQREGTLGKKLKSLGTKPGTEADRTAIQTQLADLGRKLDDATQGMDQCLLWKAPSSWQHCIVLAGDTLVAGGKDEVVGIDATTGKVSWTRKVTGRAYGIAAADGAVFVSTDQGSIHCLRQGATQASN